MRSVMFFALVAMGQIAVFVVRSRNSLVGVPPSRWLLGTTAFAFLASGAMTLGGILTPPLPAASVFVVAVSLVLAGLLLDALKLPILAGFGLAARK
jgi:hypothetical protein